MRFISFFLVLILGLINFSCQTKTPKSSPNTKVLVTIAPQKFLVQRIAKETVTTEILVPPGASPHTYEPSPHKILSATKSEIWFRLGENFEYKAIEVFKSHHPEMEIIDLRDGIELLPSCCDHCHAHCDRDAYDSHVWLSPRLLISMAQAIEAALSEKFPKNKEVYKLNLNELIVELENLDREIVEKFENSPQRTILVSHPAFAYFCRDYHLNQLSIEVEGKDPTAAQLTKLLEKARKEEVRFIFMQKQYSTKGAELIAEQLQAETIWVDPYAENVIENLHTIAALFSQF